MRLPQKLGRMAIARMRNRSRRPIHRRLGCGSENDQIPRPRRQRPDRQYAGHHRDTGGTRANRSTETAVAETMMECDPTREQFWQCVDALAAERL